jgi:potassium-transporting ATPase KdpC subunit
MLTSIFKQVRQALTALLIFTILTGAIYPFVIIQIAQTFFAYKANGSLIKINDKYVGSELIGQYFYQPKYFWGRPSAISTFPYNAMDAKSSNLAPTSPTLLKTIKTRITLLQQSLPIPKSTAALPIDLVTTSASGLDPHISQLAAFYQLPRVAKARGLPEETIQKLITLCTESRTFQILGEPRVNVLRLNLALDRMENIKDLKTIIKAKQKKARKEL